MNHCLKNSVIAIIATLLFSACGEHPPIVNNVKEIKKLPVNTRFVRARFLPEQDLYALEKLKNLLSLDFSSGWGVSKALITDNGLVILSKIDLPHLETLVLAHNENITDKGLENLTKMKSVQSLLLMDCPNITDIGLKNLRTMSNLTRLDLRGCSSITDKGLLYLAEMKNLSEIELGGCKNITKGGIEKLQQVSPEAKVNKDDAEWSLHKKNKK